jgi:hypothetical protein
MVEARDAVLAAALAKSPQDFELFARAFAKRGMGVGAEAPPRTSSSHTPVVESTAVGGQIVVESITLNDAIRSCDKDGILDNHERGQLVVRLRNTGTLPITPRARVAAEDASVGFPRGAQISFPTIAPYQSATGRLELSMEGARPQLGLALTLSMDSANLAVPGPVRARNTFLVNYDLAQNSSTEDTMDDPGAGWMTAGDTKLDSTQPWRHVRDGIGGMWSIPDSASPSDQSLITPPLVVSATGAFGFTLRHRFSFEADTFSFYDGGVVEVSTDDGMTWTDVGMPFTANGYNGTLWSQNAPLKSRKAFAGRSTGYPDYITTTASFRII